MQFFITQKTKFPFCFIPFLHTIITIRPPPLHASLHHHHTIIITSHLCRHANPLTMPSLDYFNYEIPSINVNLDSLIDEFSGAAPCRRYGAVTHSPPPGRDDNPDHDPYAVPEDDEPQDTTL